jgi:hypothetical protein
MDKEKNQPKYSRVITVLAVICDNCGQGAGVSRNHCLSQDDAIALATGAHESLKNQNKILCATPRLVIQTSYAFVDNRLITTAMTLPKNGETES